MSLRGSNIASTTSANPLSVALPAGSAVGDLAILCISNAGSPSLPSGWTSQYSFNSGVWNVLVCSKTLTSGDISTGSVSSANPFSFDQHMGIAVFIGAPTIRETQGTNGSGTSLTNTTDGSVLSSDSAIYWASVRATSVALPTIAPGSGSATSLQTALTTNAGSRLAAQAMPGGVLAVVSNFSGGINGDVAVQVIVESGLAPPGGLLVNPGMDGFGWRNQMNGGMNG
jgi:hypothetical protein